VTIDGESLGAVLPLKFADTSDRFPKVKSQGGVLRLEKEQITNHVGAPRDWHAIARAKKLTDPKTDWDREPELAVSYANACYRYGQFDLALRLIDGIATPNADYLRGLIAWERGGEVGFGKAGVEADYHRSMLAIGAGQTDKAVATLKQMIGQRPDVYRPRLMLAYLTKDRKLAEKLAEENPASAEALFVLAQMGDRGADQWLTHMASTHPPINDAIQRFYGELRGKWQHTPRYEPLLPGKNNE
jgi:hypothetical protein